MSPPPGSAAGAAAAVFLCALAGCGGGASGAARGTGLPKPKRAVLIVVDTLRADHLGCYGYPLSTTPAVDRLAGEGVRFEHALTTAPWTLPAVGALLTAQHPTALGIGDQGTALPLEVDTLAELLKGAGFATGAVISHSFCSARWNLNQGFDSFDESNVAGHDGVSSPGVTEKALAFVDAHADEPFFLWVHLFDPHFAYIQHEGFEFAGPEGYQGPIESGLSYQKLRKVELTAADGEQVRAFYDSEVAFTDRHVGMLLDGLRERGLYDDALIVFTADHGEEFLERGRIGHGWSLYQELLHVPLI